MQQPAHTATQEALAWVNTLPASVAQPSTTPPPHHTTSPPHLPAALTRSAARWCGTTWRSGASTSTSTPTPPSEAAVPAGHAQRAQHAQRAGAARSASVESQPGGRRLPAAAPAPPIPGAPPATCVSHALPGPALCCAPAHVSRLERNADGGIDFHFYDNGTQSGGIIKCAQAMFATGRAPNTRGIGLEASAWEGRGRLRKGRGRLRGCARRDFDAAPLLLLPALGTCLHTLPPALPWPLSMCLPTRLLAYLPPCLLPSGRLPARLLTYLPACPPACLPARRMRVWAWTRRAGPFRWTSTATPT